MGSSYRHRTGFRNRYGNSPHQHGKNTQQGAVRWILTVGLVLFLALAAVTLHSTWGAWQATVARNRSEAVFDLVQVATPKRPTRTPGAVAWLDLQVKRYGKDLAAEEHAEYQDLVSVAGNAVPKLLMPLRDALEKAAAAIPADPVDLHLLTDAEARARRLVTNIEEQQPEFRRQRFVDYGNTQTLVLTRRRSLDTPITSELTNSSNRFLCEIAPYLQEAARSLEENPLPSKVAGRPLEIVRIYALSEDGTFVSLPSPSIGLGKRADAEADESWRRAVRHEGEEFRKQPKLPNYVSYEFFFQFDFSRSAAQARYSGLYLDLAGHGLVTTVTVPILSAGKVQAVAAIDLAFDIDWQNFARQLEAPQEALVVDLEPTPPPSWTRLHRALGDSPIPASPALQQIVKELAEREQRNAASAETDSLYHAVVDGHGAIAFFQVARTRWLAVLFPEVNSRFPLLAAGLLVVLGLSLVAAVEVNRRRAETAQRKAEGELQEKENLLNSMKVPLTVVDPNTDAVVFGNEAAIALGLVPGRRVADLVTSARAREHYDRMQRLSSETRRAYGVPLTLRTGGEEEDIRHAVVRSVAVEAPIETLHADERHRLGIFFPLEPEADLAIFAEDLEKQTRDDERRRLAGLLAHGVDTLARVLAHRLPRAGNEDAFSHWLVDYLERRLTVTSWLLDHWHAEPPLPPETTVEASQVEATLKRFLQIFALVRDEPELRSRLHWDNGVLAGNPGDEVFELRFQWPETYLFTCPVRGGIGLFLEEVLVNAMRHGTPGSRPRVEVALDPVRLELHFEVENEVSNSMNRDLDDLEPYGGRRLLERLATLFDWPGLNFERQEDRFRVSWRIQVGERAAPGDVD